MSSFIRFALRPDNSEPQTPLLCHVVEAEIISRLMSSRLALLITFLLVLALTTPFAAQRGIGNPGVGIGARGIDTSAAPAPAQPPSITDFDTVILTVNVTGPQNNSVAGISRDRFQVLEDGVEQQISYFFEDSSPISVGFIFDSSERMNTNDKVLVLSLIHIS